MYIIIGAAGIIAGIILTIIIVNIKIARNNRRIKTTVKIINPPKKRRRLEFSKFVLTLVLSTYFIGVYVGVKVVFQEFSQLYVLLTFIGTPTAAALGFYTGKARTEKMIKLKASNPEETDGQNIDFDNIDT